MPRIPPTRPGAVNATPIIALLLGAVVVAGVLAYQAQDAVRSQRRMAERTLSEFASLASWEFARHAHMSLQALQMMSLYLPATQVEGDARSVALPSVDDFVRSVARDAAWCECVDSIGAYFRFDARDGTLEASRDEPGLRTWATETVTAHARSSGGPSPEELEYGRAPFRADSSSFYAFRGKQANILFGTVGGRARAVWYFLSHDDERRPLAAYGFEASPAALVGPLFRRILDDTPLLPRTLTGALPNDSLLAITVTDRDGTEIFRSAGGHESRFEAVDTLEEPFDDLVVRAAIRPDIAGTLVIGGLPRTRLPLLLALLGLTAGLIVVALMQLRRQSELARLRGEFVAGVSHELRTPLAQIRLFAELLHSGKLRSEEERTRSARVIDQEARRLSHLVDNVLRFSRVDHAGDRVAHEPCDLAALVREVVEGFEPLARARGIELGTELEEDVVAPVDSDALRQILLNLLDNAAKYGPAGERVTVGLERSGDVARIRVEDRGPGVPPEERERIWEAYHRLPQAVAAGTGGSGIGLAVVVELVERHGGRARVEDAPGGGARFVVELPLAVPGAPGIAPLTPQRA